MVFSVVGCADPDPPPSNDFLIKAGSVRVSAQEFAQELDIKLTAYPYDIKTKPEDYNEMVLDLVSTLSEETVLLAAAEGKAVILTPEEVALAETEFKKDYPEASFDQMLLENAITYEVWKTRFKKDMVIHKLIEQGLISVQEIKPEDMIDFYHRLDLAKSNEKTEVMDESALVEQLRMEKSQAAFDEWMKGLKAAYPLEIDKKAVAAFLINPE